MKTVNLLSGLLALFGAGHAVAQSWTVGPFTVEAVERRISSGRFPNISSNPFERTSVTNFRVLHKGKSILLPGVSAERVPPWVDVRQISGAPQPALLLMEIGAYLLTEKDGQPHMQELAPRETTTGGWQWLDSRKGQPGAVQIVGLGHRPGHVLELTEGRWLSVFGKVILDTRTLAVHRYSLDSSQLQGFYVGGETTVLAFAPGATQFVVKGSRDRQGEDGYEYALIAFDFTNQRGTVLPIDLGRWRLPASDNIDAAFAQRVVGWRRSSDGREEAFLRTDLPVQPWLGQLTGGSFQLQPVAPALQGVLASFLEREFGAVVGAPDAQGMQEVQIEGLPLRLGFGRPQERSLSIYYFSYTYDPAREAQGKALVGRIAERFNARLAAGEFQQYFIER